MRMQQTQQGSARQVQACVSEGQVDLGQAVVLAQHLGELVQTHGAEDVGAEVQEEGARPVVRTDILVDGVGVNSGRAS